ncbi:MAG TPA: hypothetical protein VG056_16160 [Pirellulales bacterium]|jgi:hypothetical protein|nr:hypothetical protein [Pirellulales bacterium]
MRSLLPAYSCQLLPRYDRALLILSAGAAALLLVIPGCGRSTSISGSVSYEGNAVGNGSIVFQPADGRGPTAGAAISDGRYQVESLMPGKKIVQIIAVKKINFAVSNEEMERQAKENANRGDTTGIVERADEIPADAVGNNREITVQPGTQTVDFELKRKPGS